MAVIFHIDLDCFFVAAERLRHPHLRGKEVAVGGSGPRGVISSASYEARKFGVRSALPTAQALRLCPKLILLPPDGSYYSALSKKVFAIVARFSPIVEATGIDEGYLDMTGSRSLFGEPLEAAAKLRQAVLQETGLTISVGIASNRLVAKVATDFCKPDNVYEVPLGQEAEFLAPMPVAKLPGCGPVSQEWLRSRGVYQIGELQRFSVETLERHLGKFGRYLHDAAWGRGSTRFHESAVRPSMSREMTFERDVRDRELLQFHLWSLCAELGTSLRKEGAFAKTIRLKLRYPPFETVTRSKTPTHPTRTDEGLFDVALELLNRHWDTARPIRLIGVGCSLGEGAAQLDFFAGQGEEPLREKVNFLRDEIRSRFGEDALKTGRELQSEKKD